MDSILRCNRSRRRVYRHSEPVQRALQFAKIAGHDMGIDFGGLDVGMAEKFLQHPDVHPVFQHVGSKTVPQGVAADFLVDPGLGRCPFHRLLYPDSST